MLADSFTHATAVPQISPIRIRPVLIRIVMEMLKTKSTRVVGYTSQSISIFELLVTQYQDHDIVCTILGTEEEPGHGLSSVYGVCGIETGAMSSLSKGWRSTFYV